MFSLLLRQRGKWHNEESIRFKQALEHADRKRVAASARTRQMDGRGSLQSFCHVGPVYPGGCFRISSEMTRCRRDREFRVGDSRMTLGQYFRGMIEHEEHHFRQIRQVLEIK